MLYTKVKLYLEANSKTWKAEEKNIGLVMTNGVTTLYWNVSGLSKPTDAQLASYETAANTEETLQKVLYNRKIDYPSIVDQLDNMNRN